MYATFSEIRWFFGAHHDTPLSAALGLDLRVYVCWSVLCARAALMHAAAR
jgi:hypothetical protein